MLFKTVVKIDTSTRMIHNISTSTPCLLLLLLLFMINSALDAHIVLLLLVLP